MAKSCHVLSQDLSKARSLLPGLVSRNNRRMTSWSRVGNTDNIQHQLREKEN